MVELLANFSDRLLGGFFGKLVVRFLAKLMPRLLVKLSVKFMTKLIDNELSADFASFLARLSAKFFDNILRQA